MFCVCVCNKLVKQCKTHILYRCFTQIQLLNSVIQRVDCKENTHMKSSLMPQQDSSILQKNGKQGWDVTAIATNNMISGLPENVVPLKSVHQFRWVNRLNGHKLGCTPFLEIRVWIFFSQLLKGLGSKFAIATPFENVAIPIRWRSQRVSW